MSKIILFCGQAEHGKTTSAILLKEMLEHYGRKVLIINFADYLKFICKTYFDWDGTKNDEGRKILQYVGTDVVRKRNPNFWVDIVVKFVKVFYQDYDYFLLADCRFENEIECFKKENMGVIAVNVVRLNFENSLTPEQRLHPSETSLKDYNFSYVIKSESGVEKLKVEVTKFMYDFSL